MSQSVNWTTDNETENEVGCRSNSMNPPPKKKQKLLGWINKETFYCKIEAEDYVKSKKDWVYHNRYKGINEEVVRYCCKMSASCSSRWRIILKDDSPITIVEQSDAEHDHESNPERGTTLIHN
jgi:hypothetical protein